MIHFGGSDKYECANCGSRLIDEIDMICLTCDSINIVEVEK
jgi:DNA-directed RNA polymerase subunit RPC12/RpoP